MPETFHCPNCGVEWKVSNQPASGRGICKHCGQPVSGRTINDSVAPKSNTSTWLQLLAVTVMIGLMVALFLPSVNTARSGRMPPCRKNLKQIGLALLTYNSVHGSLPPAFIADKDGQPMHSWRVLILPFLDESGIFAQYDFSKPWNSRRNARLAVHMPKVFRCPSSKNPRPGYTNYLASAGPGRLFDGNRATRLEEIADGQSNTLAVIEVPDSQQVSWLDPRDSFVTAAQSNHPGGANALLADGSVQFLVDRLSPETIAALQSIAGGENSAKMEAQDTRQQGLVAPPDQ